MSLEKLTRILEKIQINFGRKFYERVLQLNPQTEGEVYSALNQARAEQEMRGKRPYRFGDLQIET